MSMKMALLLKSIFFFFNIFSPEVKRSKALNAVGNTLCLTNFGSSLSKNSEAVGRGGVGRGQENGATCDDTLKPMMYTLLLL